MILKKLLIINVLLNFNFVFLQLSDTEIYFRKVVVLKKNTSEHKICNDDISLWGAVCKRIILDLRKKYSNYKNLYVNYPAFNKGSKCALRDIRLPQLTKPVPQNSLPCYARPKMISIGMPNQFLQYHKEIIIFPYLKSNIIIFNRIPNTEEYTVLKILRKFNWTLEPLNRDLFTISIPMVQENIEVLYPYLRAKCLKLYDESVNEHNIVNFSNRYIYDKLCKSILNSPKYDQEIDVNLVIRSSTNKSKKCKNVALHIPQEYFDSIALNCPIKACQCIEYNPVTNEKITTFSVAAVEDNSSVILLKRTNFFIEGFQLYNVVAYFENVNIAYLHNYEHY